MDIRYVGDFDRFPCFLLLCNLRIEVINKIIVLNLLGFVSQDSFNDLFQVNSLDVGFGA